MMPARPSRRPPMRRGGSARPPPREELDHLRVSAARQITRLLPWQRDAGERSVRHRKPLHRVHDLVLVLLRKPRDALLPAEVAKYHFPPAEIRP